MDWIMDPIPGFRTLAVAMIAADNKCTCAGGLVVYVCNCPSGLVKK